jgi:hypothetical protein
MQWYVRPSLRSSFIVALSPEHVQCAQSPVASRNGEVGCSDPSSEMLRSVTLSAGCTPRTTRIHSVRSVPSICPFKRHAPRVSRHLLRASSEEVHPPHLVHGSTDVLSPQARPTVIMIFA